MVEITYGPWRPGPGREVRGDACEGEGAAGGGADRWWRPPRHGSSRLRTGQLP